MARDIVFKSILRQIRSFISNHNSLVILWNEFTSYFSKKFIVRNFMTLGKETIPVVLIGLLLRRCERGVETHLVFRVSTRRAATKTEIGIYWLHSLNNVNHLISILFFRNQTSVCLS
jgi:hypothetical protein